MNVKKHPVLILPGWRLEPRIFAPLTEELERRGYPVFVVPFPGFSDASKLSKVYTLSDYVDFVEKYLQKNKLSQSIIIAHSFGGRVALKLLSQQPAIAHALILTGVPGFRSLTARAQIVKAVAQYVKPGENFRNSSAGKLLFRFFGAHDLSKLDGNMRQTFINVVEEPLDSYMEKIKTKTLLIWGAGDGLVSTGVAKKMQKVIKNAQLKIIQNARHSVPYRNAREFVTIMESFLESL